MAQRRKIMNIISEKIVYKNKSFDIKLRTVFQDLVENHCKMTQKIGVKEHRIALSIKDINKDAE